MKSPDHGYGADVGQGPRGGDANVSQAGGKKIITVKMFKRFFFLYSFLSHIYCDPFGLLVFNSRESNSVFH